jgi:hypothetical protein
MSTHTTDATDARIAAYLATLASYEARYAACYAHHRATGRARTAAEIEAAPHARGIRGTHRAAMRNDIDRIIDGRAQFSPEPAPKHARLDCPQMVTPCPDCTAFDTMARAYDADLTHRPADCSCWPSGDTCPACAAALKGGR